MKDYILCNAINTIIDAIYKDHPHLIPQIKKLVDEINKNDPPITYTLTSSEQITFIDAGDAPQLAPPRNWVLTDSASNHTRLLSVPDSITLDRIIGRKQ